MAGTKGKACTGLARMRSALPSRSGMRSYAARRDRMMMGGHTWCGGISGVVVLGRFPGWMTQSNRRGARPLRHSPGRGRACIAFCTSCVAMPRRRIDLRGSCRRSSLGSRSLQDPVLRSLDVAGSGRSRLASAGDRCEAQPVQPLRPIFHRSGGRSDHTVSCTWQPPASSMLAYRLSRGWCSTLPQGFWQKGHAWIWPSVSTYTKRLPLPEQPTLRW